jgi:hypothetical protein
MEAFENYAFDVRGFVLVRTALSAEEVVRTRQALESGGDLAWVADTEAAASRMGELCKKMQRGAILPMEPRIACPLRPLVDEGSHFLGGGARHER